MAAPPAVHPNKAAFIEGVELSLASWTALRLAIDNDWGNDGLGEEKEAWMCDVLVDYFGQRAQRVEPEDVEDILLQIMQDEFNTMLEDGSAYELGKQLVAMYREVIHGNHRLVEELRAKAARRRQQPAFLATQSRQEATANDDDDDDDDDDDSDDGSEDGDADAPSAS
ncbi:Pre-rRNA-processing protein TSR2-domain-containing protein [Syncephalis pseudoplumigaleata]|uniref:Pre-rRNA-processing protein TSR2-domain-containing protein n=1 Tax=Syncephalis pseudoplumigaleata TaxID=1712513 RepID=A0A4P9Z808_9FUNG|nr:Pre-rRNA-processing protein TSR2-domain-containing protein [Syncephalis pseudoplumigaleata]|eukprot:RKP28071.1 Pre-rRNA-processing protein TSR2-domain-containing protein [Syncephalis pseudoplumigaleata]